MGAYKRDAISILHRDPVCGRLPVDEKYIYSMACSPTNGLINHVDKRPVNLASFGRLGFYRSFDSDVDFSLDRLTLSFQTPGSSIHLLSIRTDLLIFTDRALGSCSLSLIGRIWNLSP